MVRALTAGAAAFALPGAASAVGRTASSLDVADRRDLARIFRKLAFSAGERLGFWWLSGTRYALLETDPIPLWQMHVGRIFRIKNLEDGKYSVTSMNVSFYTDLNTGDFIRKIVNPFTGKTIDIGYLPPKPDTIVYDAYGRRTDAPTGALAALEHIDPVGPAWIEGDQVWMRDDHLLRGRPKPPGDRPIRVNDLTTYFGSVSAVADPKTPMPLAGQTFSDINSWPPWLEMGDHPGDYYSRAYGRKVAAFDDMPTVWRKLMVQEHSRIAKDPAGALG